MLAFLDKACLAAGQACPRSGGWTSSGGTQKRRSVGGGDVLALQLKYEVDQALISGNV